VMERTLQLEVLNKELETFSYSVSHDLQAPLRRIMTFTEALRADTGSVQSAESSGLIAKIAASSTRMNSLIGALLELSHLSRQPIKRESVDLSALAHLTANELQQGQPERHVAFSIAEGVQVKGDAPLLRAVLENLLGNAWKYTSRMESARIEFGRTRQPDGSESYFVKDNGAGFDMAYSDKLFTAFQRLHSEKEFPGIGIGLATVQRVIDRHNGRVWAEGAVGKGASFHFTLGKA